MKLHAQTHHSVSTNIPGKASFKIEASHKAFEILSSGIYSDIISAIMRELACNAYDAQVVAGKKDVPIKVHLPTPLEPWFSVSDVGCGMSEQDIYDIYTSYFTSTKTDSNDVIGALGLGSKSPFSYTESFTVESSKDGVRNSFVCFIDETGMPSLTKTSSVECAWTGTTVKVPIKEKDFNTFINKARLVFTPFYPAPDINLEEDQTDKFPKILYRGEHCLIIDRTINHQSYVVQGNVAYKVAYTYCWGDSNVMPIYDIGDLSFTASREEIHYDDLTVENLKNSAKKQAVRNEVKQFVRSEIEKQPDLLSAISKYRMFKRIFSSSLVDNDKDPLTYDGFELTPKNIVLSCPKRFKGRVKSRRFDGTRANKIRYFDSKTSVYLDEVEVFYMDVRSYTKRVNKYVVDSRSGKHVVVLPTADPKALQRLSKGIIDIKPVSSLPEPPKVARSVAQPTPTFIDYDFSNSKLVGPFGYCTKYIDDYIDRDVIRQNAKRGKTQYYIVDSDDISIASSDYPYLSYVAKVMCGCDPWDIMQVPSRSRNIKVFKRWNDREGKELFVNITDLYREAKDREWDSFYYISPVFNGLRTSNRPSDQDKFWASTCIDEFGPDVSVLGQLERIVGLGDGRLLRMYQEAAYDNLVRQYPLMNVIQHSDLFEYAEEKEQRKLLRMIVNSTKE